ncbi:putative transcriptional regulator STERILE APETALA-like [Capsicum annuum]|nr:putative transcriptional regulator STERILE APETALA-like [Capsicum annuum]
MQTGPIQRTFPETQSSRNLDKSVRLSVEAETGPASHINKKKERGKYKSKTMDFKFKHGGKIKIMIPDDIDIAVGSGARDIVNYCGWIMKTTVSFRDGSRQQIVLKHGEAMWYRFKGKFEVRNGLLDHKLQGFVGQLQQLVVEQQSEKIELCMIGDEILSSILGERSGYIQGKGHSNKPPEKN